MNEKLVRGLKGLGDVGLQSGGQLQLGNSSNRVLGVGCAGGTQIARTESEAIGIPVGSVVVVAGSIPLHGRARGIGPDRATVPQDAIDDRRSGIDEVNLVIGIAQRDVRSVLVEDRYALARHRGSVACQNLVLARIDDQRSTVGDDVAVDAVVTNRPAVHVHCAGTSVVNLEPLSVTVGQYEGILHDLVDLDHR